MRLVDVTSGRHLASRVTLAASPWTRLVGWLFRARVESDEGLWFPACGAIHTLGMRTAIDLIFLDRDDRVCWTQAGVPPGRQFISCRSAHALLEMGPGFLARCKVPIGHVLRLEPGSV